MCKSMLLSCLAGYVPLALLFLFSCLLVCLLLLPVLTVDCFEFVGCTYFSFGQDLPQQSRISTSIHRTHTHTHTHKQINFVCGVCFAQILHIFCFVTCFLPLCRCFVRCHCHCCQLRGWLPLLCAAVLLSSLSLHSVVIIVFVVACFYVSCCMPFSALSQCSCYCRYFLGLFCCCCRHICSFTAFACSHCVCCCYFCTMS